MSLRHKMRSSVIVVLKHNKDGSYRTQDDRSKSLINIANTLYELGYKMEHLRSMKQKHIYALVKHWKDSGTVTADSMRNRMSHIRWLMQKWNKEGMVPTNKILEIPPRKSTTNIDKSRTLSKEDEKAITDPLMRHSLKAQLLFGLRVEESLKIKPFIADQGNRLYMAGPWCKGGRERYIPIRTLEQRDWIDEAKRLVEHKDHSMIPPNTKYVTYRERFKKRCQRANIYKRHGLRHNYAQGQYKDLTGRNAPVKSSSHYGALNEQQKTIEHNARLKITESLGHSRISIVDTYIGRSK